MSESKHSVKAEARRIIEELPEDASWDELIRRIYVRQIINKGLQDSEEGRTIDMKELRSRVQSL